MAGDGDRIKTTIDMRRSVWNEARVQALRAGVKVGDYLEQLVLAAASSSVDR